MKKILLVLAAALLSLALPALAQENANYALDGGRLTIALEENASTGYQWYLEIDDETVLRLAGDETTPAQGDRPGAPAQRAFTLEAVADGEAIVSLYYQRAWEDEAPAQTLCYTLAVTGGKISACEYEDMTGWDEEQGDDASVLRFDGETGGVEVFVPEGLQEVAGEEGERRFASADGAIWLSVEYDPDEDAQALLAELADEEAAHAAYDDEEAGTQLLSCEVDQSLTPPRAMVVYTQTGEEGVTIVDYTLYAAPEGGVTYVKNGYQVAE